MEIVVLCIMYVVSLIQGGVVYWLKPLKDCWCTSAKSEFGTIGRIYLFKYF